MSASGCVHVSGPEGQLDAQCPGAVRAADDLPQRPTAVPDPPVGWPAPSPTPPAEEPLVPTASHPSGRKRGVELPAEVSLP